MENLIDLVVELEDARDAISDYIGGSIDSLLNRKLEKIKKDITDIILFQYTNDIKYLLD